MSENEKATEITKTDNVVTVSFNLTKIKRIAAVTAIGAGAVLVIVGASKRAGYNDAAEDAQLVAANEHSTDPQ